MRTKIASSLMLGGGVLGMLAGALIAAADTAVAQVIPDNTLGAETSQVTAPAPGAFLIDGGATRGTNLFHSFSQFSVPPNGVAAFNNALNIQNIITRVTGTSVSNIEGVLQANGTANLFLLNPNGIIFGPNASLNIGGSFVGTTANAIQFGEQGLFSATNPTAPALLSVNPSALLFNQIRAQQPKITVTSSNQFLGVPDNRSLILVGGEVRIDGGALTAPGGRVELGAVAGIGAVNLHAQGSSDFSLDFPDFLVRGDVQLAKDAAIFVGAAQEAGSVAITARTLSVSDSNILSLASSGTSGGIVLDITEAASFWNSQVATTNLGKGAGGDVVVMTGTLQLLNARIVTLNSAPGKGGNLTVKADEVQLQRTAADGVPSGLLTLAYDTGDAGTLSITTSTLQVLDGAQINASTLGSGRSGEVTLNANEVLLQGTAADGVPSGLFTLAGGTGDAGTLSITTNALQVLDGARIDASTLGSGKGGQLTINAEQVLVQGTSTNGRPSSLSTAAALFSTGDAGDLSITTNTLQVLDGAQMNASTFGSGKGGQLTVKAEQVLVKGTATDGQFLFPSGLFTDTEGTGDAGDLSITTNTLQVLDGAQISASTSGSGKGGQLTVKAEQVLVKGTAPDGQFLFPSGLFTLTGGTGDAGNLSITTNTLQVLDGAQIDASTRGSGKGGQLTINAEQVLVQGTSTNGRLSSGSGLRTQTQGTGDAGDLNIATNTLQVLDGAQISASTFGSGKGGQLTVKAEQVLVKGTAPDGQFPSGLLASAEDGQPGAAGDIQIQTTGLTLQEGATVSVSAPTSQAGNLTIHAQTLRLDRGWLTATTGATPTQAPGANIRLQGLDVLLMENGSLISARATGDAQGGNIVINAASGFVVATPNANNDIIASATQGQGGQINITAQGLFNFAQGKAIPGNRTNDIDASSDFGTAGTVVLNTPEVDPSRGTVELPANFVDAAGLIAQGCYPRNPSTAQTQSEFLITGRGGIPTRPGEPLHSSPAVVELVAPVAEAATQPQRSDARSEAEPETIVVAQGWEIAPNGEVVLTANPYSASVPQLGPTAGCPAR